jgi:hypothetical protein
MNESQSETLWDEEIGRCGIDIAEKVREARLY